MRKLSLTITMILVAMGVAASAQRPSQRMDPKNSHVRVWAIDRVVVGPDGSRQPAHLDANMLGFVAYYHPGNSQICLVEYVARDSARFNLLRQDAQAPNSQVRVFEKTFGKRQDFENAVRALGFPQIDLDKFYASIP